jgi:hypothetical protein
MPVKKIFVNLLGVMLIAFLSLPATAEMVRVAFFKGTAIPFGLKYKDIVLEKDKYDLEVLFSKADTNFLYLLRFIKKGTILCEVSGLRLEYATTFLPELNKDPNIPNEPTIRMKKMPPGNTINIIFESGKKANIPFEKVVFKMEYIQ